MNDNKERGIVKPLKSWWETELAHSTLDEDESYSEQWRSELGIHREAADYKANSGDEGAKFRLKSVARKLARTVNVLRNAEDDDGRERKLNIAFSDGSGGTINTPNNDTIYLSPDSVANCRSDLAESKAMDVLTGQVLIAQAMKRTASEHCLYKAKEGEMVTRELWQAVEQAIARNEVLKEWAGFEGYFQRHADETGANKADVQDWIDGTEASPTVDAVALAMSWNLLHPSDRVTLPSVYGPCCDAGMDILRKMGNKNGRYNACKDAVEEMRRILSETPPPKQQPKPGPGKEGEGKGKGKGKSEGEGEPPKDGKGSGQGKPDKSEGEPPPPEKGEKPTGGPAGGEPSGHKGTFHMEKPTVTDATLFGETVDCNENLKGKLPEATGLEDTEERDVECPPGVRTMSEVAVINAFCEWKDGEIYNIFTKSMQGEINAITKALAFRNNDAGYFVRGQQSGELDDGSLYKTALREDNPAVWQQREVLSQPKIAVGILVDESGSMRGMKILESKRVCIAMTAALAKVKGVSTMIVGHTAECERGVDRFTIHPKTGDDIAARGFCTKVKGLSGGVYMSEYLTINHKNPYALAYMEASGNNLDGYAMEIAARKMAVDYADHPTRLLFVISDGAPAGYRYGGDPALQHMNNVVQFSERALGVGIYGIGICNAYPKDWADKMYGNGRAVVISDVVSSLSILTSFIAQIARKV